MEVIKHLRVVYEDLVPQRFIGCEPGEQIEKVAFVGHGLHVGVRKRPRL